MTTTPAAPGPADIMRPESLVFLKELLDTPSPSGFERDGQRVWMKYVRGFAGKAWNDSYNNCFASFGPEGPGVPTIAICGHADEIGLMVNHIDDKGFIYCKAIGGIDVGSIVGKRVRFQSSVPGVKNPVIGLIGATAIHLQDKSAEGKVRKMHELFIDIGAANADEAKSRLQIGDAGVFLDGFMQLSDDLVVARALDNRIGTWVAAEALRLCAQQPERRVRVVAVSTVQEEVGLHGAQMIADSLRPDVALVTDVGHATDSPGITHAQHGLFKMGAGPKIAIGSAMQPEVVARLLRTAERLSIPLQRGAVPGSSGTDTDSIFLAAGGIPCGLVSFPIRYMHTTVEMGHLRDLDQIAQVFAGFCEGMTGSERFAPEL